MIHSARDKADACIFHQHDAVLFAEGVGCHRWIIQLSRHVMLRWG
jgi:hypothetical protein